MIIFSGTNAYEYKEKLKPYASFFSFFKLYFIESILKNSLKKLVCFLKKNNDVNWKIHIEFRYFGFCKHNYMQNTQCKKNNTHTYILLQGFLWLHCRREIQKSLDNCFFFVCLFLRHVKNNSRDHFYGKTYNKFMSFKFSTQFSSLKTNLWSIIKKIQLF